MFESSSTVIYDKWQHLLSLATSSQLPPSLICHLLSLSTSRHGNPVAQHLLSLNTCSHATCALTNALSLPTIEVLWDPRSPLFVVRFAVCPVLSLGTCNHCLESLCKCYIVLP